MPHVSWETTLVTKAINKTIAQKPKRDTKRKILKQKQNEQAEGNCHH